MADIFLVTFSKAFFLNENLWILLKISLKFVPKVRISSIQTLVQIMAWRRPGNKPNQWWLVYWRIYASIGINELTQFAQSTGNWITSFIVRQSRWKCMSSFLDFISFPISLKLVGCGIPLWPVVVSLLGCGIPDRPGMGVTKVYFSVSKIFDLAKVPVRFFESHSYLTGVTADELRWHLPNIKVIFNS